MSDLASVLFQPGGAPASGRLTWRMRFLPWLAASGLTGLLIVGLLDWPAHEPAAPEPVLSPWVEAGAPIYELQPAGFIRPPHGEAWTRRAGPGRQDVLTFRDEPGDGAWLRVGLHLAGPLDPAPGSFYLDLTRVAARAGVAVTRASLPVMQQIRFGGLEVAEVALAEGEGARACLGFRLLAGEPDLRLLGFACDRERQPEPRALACTLDGLQLLAPGADEGLARFFAAAELASGLEPRLDCTVGRSGQKMVRRP